MGGFPKSKGCRACRQQKKRCQGLQAPCDRCVRLGISCDEFGEQRYLFKSEETPEECFQPQSSLARTGQSNRRQSMRWRHTATLTPLPKANRLRSHPKDGDTLIVVELPVRATVSTRTFCRKQQASQSWKSPSLALCNIEKEEAGRLRTGIPHLYQPRSEETIFILHALDTIKYEDAEKSWFRYLPPRVGRSLALDLSIKAIVTACAYARGVPKVLPKHCYKALGKALSALQQDINDTERCLSDETLASVALLAPFEGVIKKYDVPMRSHVEGLAAILALRPAAYPRTDLSRGILDFHICDFCIMASIKGLASPLEKINMHYYDPNISGSGTEGQVKVRALGSELFIRLPRLVTRVRSLESQPTTHAQQLHLSICYAQELLDLEDAFAEEEAMKMVTISPETQTGASYPLGLHLCFENVEVFESLMYYWQSRLSLFRLCSRLHHIHMKEVMSAGHIQSCNTLSSPNPGTTSTETWRVTLNILKSIDYASRLKLRKRRRLLSHAIVVCWGAIVEEPRILCQTPKLQDLKCMQAWLLGKLNDALAANPALTASDVDEAADMFAGGPVKGRFALLYSSTL